MKETMKWINKIKYWLNAEDVQSEMGGNIMVSSYRYILALFIVILLIIKLIKG
jgi:hypothetical protein